MTSMRYSLSNMFIAAGLDTGFPELTRLLELLTFAFHRPLRDGRFARFFAGLPKILTIAEPSRPANAHPYGFGNEYRLTH
jgi:hypothetical protein